MASFLNNVKEEICKSINDRDKKYACLYGILLYCRSLSENQISFSTECGKFAELFEKLLKNVFSGKINYRRETGTKKNGITFYSFLIDDRESIERIFRVYNILPENREVNLENIVNNSMSAFIAGVFFICGSVSDPYKEYHLEFTVPSEKLYENLNEILMDIDIELGKIIRKGTMVAYVKNSENIEDILTFMGARQGTIDLMNIKIYKDVRNKANRIANCDSANIDKVIATAMRQIDDINYIISQDGFENLSDDLREVSEIRLENPEISLQEIGEMLKKPISRSGVARRFQKISKIAEEMRKNENGVI